MALCRRRASATRLAALVSVAWVLLLLFFLVERQDAPAPFPPREDAVQSARHDLDSILSGGAAHRGRPPAPGPIPQPQRVTPAAGRTPSTRSRSGREGGDPRGFLLPPQEARGPGELGKPVRLPANLTKEQQALVDAGWEATAFNQYVSDMVSPHRSLPDVRDDKCRERRDWGHLPDTGVVVCFHNEAWSTLIRTMHSVLDRSPQHLMKELVLVDDFSDRAHLGSQLDQYVAQYPRVKVVRTNKREGLIRARLIGARHVTADVITFLDSHCECTEGWLEPLLDRIGKNSTTVVTPVIDVIDDTTLEYHFQKASDTSVGGFDWNLQFNWHAIPDREKKLHAHPSEPVATPTMAGGLFAIDRLWFQKLGTYDEGFDIWGGENLEISFKTWMCGGRLETVPCSHVGHIFRRRSPYSWRSGENVLRKNSVRLAEVWLDEYKEFYYDRIGRDLGDFGDVSNRKALRKRLNCKSFKWYLTEVYPELFIPGDAVALGEIRNEIAAICLDSPMEKDSLYKPIGLFPCHLMGGNQYFLMSKLGEIRRDEVCLDFAGTDVVLYPCHGSQGNQRWSYKPQSHLLYHEVTQTCMGLSEDMKKIEMTKCDAENKRQRWLFQNYNATKML